MPKKEENYYSTRFKFDPGRVKVWTAITEYLQPYIGSDKVVLDLGAGYGDFINLVKAKKKYALDLNASSKEYLKKDVKFINKPSTSLEDIKTNTLDVVFASNLFEHLEPEQLDKTMKGIKRCLRKNGTLILIQPNFRYSYKNYFDDYTHKAIFTHISLADAMFEYGFIAKKVVPKFLPLTLKSRLPKSYILTKAYINSPVKPQGKQMLLIFEAKNV